MTYRHMECAKDQAHAKIRRGQSEALMPRILMLATSLPAQSGRKIKFLQRRHASLQKAALEENAVKRMQRKAVRMAVLQ